MKSQTKQHAKIKYFLCKKGDLHQGQVLNYVCVDQKCQQKGLICSMCKNQHANHLITPLKFLLVSLTKHSQKPMETQHFQDHLQNLQQVKNLFLYELRVAVQHIANQIRKVQEMIINNYKKSKSALLRQVELSMKYNDIINSAINDKCQNQEQFEKDFKVIANCVMPVANSNNSSFVFSLNLQKIVQVFQSQFANFKKSLIQYSQKANTLSTVFNSKEIQVQSKRIIKIKGQNATQSQQKYVFSSKHKGSSMKVQDDGRLISCQKTSPQRFALIDQVKGNQIKKIRLKIQKLKHWIAVGVAIRKKIVSLKYNFNYNQLGHGSYLLSNNCYSWSHSNLSNNLKTTNFSFKQGDTIYMEFANKKLKFINQTTSVEVLLDIQANKQQEQDLCFCVNLSQAEDSVSIVE